MNNLTVTNWKRILLGLASIGLADSAYLLYDYFTQSAACGIGGCNIVTTSAYNNIYGVPVSLLGFLWFAALILLAFPLESRAHPYLLPGLWFLGIIGAGYLIYVELVRLHAICVYCTLAHALGIALGLPIFELARLRRTQA